jgi:hypothetical protein
MRYFNNVQARSVNYRTKKAKKTRLNATWIRPGRGTDDHHSEPIHIDHILVCNLWKSWVKSCHVDWRASILMWGQEQDHGTLCTKFKVTARGSLKRCRRFIVLRLKDEGCCDNYRSQLKRRLDNKWGRWLKSEKLCIPPFRHIDPRM